MKIFFDTEFQEYRPDCYTLISLGAVRDDGEEFYAEADWWDPAGAHDWLKKFVVPKLTGFRMNKRQMRSAFIEFVGPVQMERPEFWGYFCCHDWFLLLDMLGGFMKTPDRWPQWCNDIQTIRTATKTLHVPNVFLNEETEAHNALTDAKWTKAMYERFVEPVLKAPTQT